jgi:hypothetical protein
MSDEVSGVVHSLGPLPPIEPGPIASAVKQVTFAALSGLPPDARGAIVHLSHERGVEVAMAHRSQDGRWRVDAWFGKELTKSSTINWTASASVLW